MMTRNYPDSQWMTGRHLRRKGLVFYLLIVGFLLSGPLHQLATVIFPVMCLFQFCMNKTIIMCEFDRRMIKFAGVYFIYLWIGRDTSVMLRIEEIVKFSSLISVAILLNRMPLEKLQQLPYYFSLLLIVTAPVLFPFRLLDGRYMGIFEHPNHLAYVTVILLASQLILAKLKRKKLNILIALGLFALILLSKSSGGLLITMVVYAINQFYDLRRMPVKSMLISGAIISIGFVVYFTTDVVSILMSKIEMVDFSELSKKISRMNFGGEGSGMWRLAYWGAILNTFWHQSDYVHVFGHGAGAMSQGNFIYSFMRLDPHNDYVRLIVEYGIFGSLVVVSGWIYVISCVQYRVIIIMALLGPMFFGNILVNFPYMLSLIVSLKVLERTVSNFSR